MFKDFEDALRVVSEKKAKLDAASAEVKLASDDYQKALKAAQAMHAQVSSTIASILPGSHTRVA